MVWTIFDSPGARIHIVSAQPVCVTEYMGVASGNPYHVLSSACCVVQIAWCRQHCSFQRTLLLLSAPCHTTLKTYSKKKLTLTNSKSLLYEPTHLFCCGSNKNVAQFTTRFHDKFSYLLSTTLLLWLLFYTLLFLFNCSSYKP